MTGVSMTIKIRTALVVSILSLFPSLALADACSSALDDLSALQLRQASQLGNISIVPSMDPVKEAADLCNISRTTYQNLLDSLESQQQAQAVCGRKFKPSCDSSCFSGLINKAKSDSETACTKKAPAMSTAEGDNGCANITAAVVSLGTIEKDQDLWIRQCNNHPDTSVCQSSVDFIRENGKSVPPGLTCRH